ncbi:type IV secretory system conjugative DNA transfer family protein [Priestia aryabhattai]|uniref:VirD4-like conjugal transfer protein, CD1115 family n=1 Tax=Priestia aryabhattai TaxID=412384 RepID=UPI002881FC03|nr:type IV secretory system conjugative DNA transfer family protein [Priestia aryabhattai]MDT0149897.1 type IV secretory system conjugative DNA transfer family protein [Priestia aryabhattai]MDT0155450.1 type IV secretory system conjugative DNA transfer family protein [Priestia aryabhattai]
MQPNKSIKYVVAEKQVLIPLSACFFVSILLILNFLFNMMRNLVQTTFSDVFEPQPFHLETSFLTEIHLQQYSPLYGGMCLVATLLTAKFAYNIRSNFKNLNHNQKGSGRFTTRRELKKQYRKVPEKTATYQGGGGVPVSRIQTYDLIQTWKEYKALKGIQKLLHAHRFFTKKSYMLIDDTPVNNLIIGITRSGKGETFVFPTIDIYSRAEKQPSLVCNDPKGELLAASKNTLEERGYHVEVLNLLNPLESMSYNLLEMIKETYKDGDYSTAQALCNTLSYTLYYNPNAKDPFWQQCAMSLCNAMILAVTDKCIKEKEENKITMYTVANMLSELGSKEVVINKKGDTQNALDLYFDGLPTESVAKMQYATSNFSKGTTRGGIFTQTMNGLSIFTFDEIAKMTSKNSVDLKRVGFGKTIKGKAAPLTRLEMTFPDGQKETIKTDAKGLFEVNFTSEVKQNDEIILTEKFSDKIVTSSRLETVISINRITRETGATTFTVNKQHPSIHVKEVTCFTKPIAIFMVTPDYDSSNHVIASIFVRQLYYILAKNASLAKGNKCHREVIFLLDEFGNMPAIEGMSNIITVCLGRNIRFNLVIQAYAQLKNKYGNDAETIEGNCGNTIYILSNNYETAKTISQKLGDGTINSTSRSGKGLSTDKSKTEGVDGKPLLTPNELMELKEGESVVVRVVKRQDKARQRIKAHPIYNTGKTALKYRWEYLGEDFNTDRSILDIDISSLHEQVNPRSLVIHNFFPFQSQAPSVEIEEELTDDPFNSLTYENYKTKTVKEFFGGDKNVSTGLKVHLPKAMNKTVEEIEQQSMSEFEEELKMLGVSDQLNKNVHKLLEVKITTIIKNLQHEMEEQEA